MTVFLFAAVDDVQTASSSSANTIGFLQPAPFSNPPSGTPTPSAPPAGYANVWEDDRLNPNRGPQAYVAKASQPVATPTADGTLQNRYVQVGTYSVSSNAQAAAQVLLALGMSPRIGKVVMSGQEHLVVVAGPFDGQAALMNALNSARSAGFSDAFLRR